MKINYEEISVSDIKVCDKIKFDILENNKQVFIVTAISKHFIIARTKLFGRDYYTMILKEPLQYNFYRNFNIIEKGSYIRGTTICWGIVGKTPKEDEEALNFLENEILENRKYVNPSSNVIVPQADAEYYISDRNRIGIKKLFRRC